MSTSSGNPTQTHTLRVINDGGSRKRRNKTKNRQATATSSAVAGSTQVVTVDSLPTNESEDETLCWICAEPVKFYSVSECNHRTCHVCALRLRALYKKMDCTFCKYPQTTLIFTLSPDDAYESYLPQSIPFKDQRLSIFFESQDMMEETLILLRFNCPESSCDFTAHGWGDLKMHVRAIHSKSMCDMCIRHKKVFAHEHILYQASQLALHLPSMSHRPSKSQDPDKVDGGVHPMCQFCRECFFGDDELFVHMRERHEECFICKREGIRDNYFKDYNSLEHHFTVSHFPCKNPQCLAQKFVVFGSVLDLKAHAVDQHGGEMTARDRKDVRRIDTAFDPRPTTESRSGNRPARSRPEEREREPSGSGPPPQGRRREAFRSALTSESMSQSISTPHWPDDQVFPSTDGDPQAEERNAAFVARINILTSNSATAVPAIKAALRSYKSSESGPRDLISTVFNVVNREVDGTASLINFIMELLDDEEKRRELLAAWNGFKIEHQRQFPDLVPAAAGAEYAGVAGGRILHAKHSVRSSSRQVWDRVAQAAASSSSLPDIPAIRSQERFPALAASRMTPPFRQSQHNTPWSAAGSSAAPTSSSRGTSTMRPVTRSPAPSSSPQPAPPQMFSPQMSAALFPTLPSSSNINHHKPILSGNQSLKHIRGETNTNAWGSKSAEPQTTAETSFTTENYTDSQPPDGSRTKKKKGKEKQTLFTIGTFPT